ncbi:D-aminoacyl-tRNA deacylase [Vallitalea guaymasensis]|uniref:D-aminoacyl-tRNA deacylase n=1 Tax=Vallitalea guaymasensis TaxID=1185412 RepID=A0A8J8MDS8_9FIRM|nr:D-aminoacyl-tRNA deacylase [Vallitalea guaymasensis]QUH31199.1 D-tyrosyl-tRNA(Tyr) deacylase [Vallitalea guaymasensis]
MRVVVQRVKHASVKVEGELIGEIGKGILVLVGFLDNDDMKVYDYMLDKIINLRIFEDEDDKMNLSVKDIEGEIIIVPNFTLYGDCRKGRRPSYSVAAKPDKARMIFDEFIKRANEKYDGIKQGMFQADMKVELLNDGPVTLLLDSEKVF